MGVQISVFQCIIRTDVTYLSCIAGDTLVHNAPLLEVMNSCLLTQIGSKRVEKMELWILP